VEINITKHAAARFFNLPPATTPTQFCDWLYAKVGLCIGEEGEPRKLARFYRQAHVFLSGENAGAVGCQPGGVQACHGSKNEGPA